MVETIRFCSHLYRGVVDSVKGGWVFGRKGIQATCDHSSGFFVFDQVCKGLTKT